MRFVFEEDEKRIEYWLKPFTARALFPGYKMVMFEDTRAYWNTYWELLWFGLTDTQIADYALTWRHFYRQPNELAMSQSVIALGRYHGIMLPKEFFPPVHSPLDYASFCMT